MRDALHLCREVGQPLTWWLDLDAGMQALYLADLEERIEADNRRAKEALARAKRRR